MSRHVFLTVLIGALVLLIVGLLLPAPNPDERPQRLPWQVRPVPDGLTRVFGLTLGETTLGEAEAAFGEEAKVNLFVNETGERAVEAYFDALTLEGLQAKMILTVGVDPATREGMYKRGLRIATLGSGSKRVTLHPDDLARVRRTAVTAITYMPKIDLDPKLVEKRFGEPARRIEEAETGIVHWLYPDKGLDIAVKSAGGQDVLQYVPPKEFEKLVRPLEP